MVMRRVLYYTPYYTTYYATYYATVHSFFCKSEQFYHKFPWHTRIHTKKKFYKHLPMHVVYASFAIKSNDAVSSSHRMCAERAYIEREIEIARRRGVRPESLRRYIKRKIGHLAVYRFTKDGCLAVSCPCRLCREALLEYDIRVTYVDRDGTIVSRIRPDEIPDDVLTTSQRLRRHIG